MSDANATAFENALRDNPDDLAGWCAFADYLAEQGDPRGEFMQVQLALEDESRAKEERDALKKREADLLALHEREWLGELAPFVLDDDISYHASKATCVRGHIAELQCGSLSVNMARALARTPGTGFLRLIAIERTAYENRGDAPTSGRDACFAPGPDVPSNVGEDDAPSLHALLHAPQLAGVRIFRYGNGPTGLEDDNEYRPCREVGTLIPKLVARMPQLEALFLYAFDVNTARLFALPMSNLRTLRIDHESNYPLEVLAANPALCNLSHLFCHPHAQRPDDPDAFIRIAQFRALCRSPHLRALTHLHLRLTDFGDDGIDELIASGLLGRLKVLDLSYGCVTDKGALALAACPDLRNLTRLDLSQNAIEEAGIAALKATGVNVNTESQHGEHPDRIDEHGWLEYLSYGDME